MTKVQFHVTEGVYPTMITPYKNGNVDYAAAEKLVEWYWQQGCDGIFAVCLSSEIFCLTLEERVRLTRTVVQTARRLAKNDKSRKPMMIVASGHVSDAFEDQVTELCAIAQEQPDALILISNRMNIEGDSDEKWISDAEQLIERLPKEIPLGIYECPVPYKRELSERILRWCAKNDRFYFIKDTCCDAERIAERLRICEGSQLKLFNANAQTFLKTMQYGAAGYCGVMANFQPSLYAWLVRHWKDEPQKAALVQDFLCMSTIAEGMNYPCSAKYYLDRYVGIPMELTARSVDHQAFSSYQRHCVDQFAEMNEFVQGQMENASGNSK